jgi:SpoU rRNA methylase family enzyme
MIWARQTAAAFPARKALRLALKAGVFVLIFNELRGIAVVVATAPVWWPLITGMFHAALRGR